MLYFNPPTPRGVGPVSDANDETVTAISIHPPREGWDGERCRRKHDSITISIHPPREGWDEVDNDAYFYITISIHPPREGWDNIYCR